MSPADEVAAAGAADELREAKAEIARLRAKLDSCPIGRYCGAHETRHVGEAEELRSRFKDLAERWKEVRAILGTVDTRDSPEALDEPG